MLRNVIANLSTHPFLIFVSYSSLDHLFAQMEQAWKYTFELETTDEKWQRHLTYLSSSLLKDILP